MAAAACGSTAGVEAGALAVAMAGGAWISTASPVLTDGAGADAVESAAVSMISTAGTGAGVEAID
jgi:hypothetical protein